MNDFQEQAKNWLRNVVKQNPDKVKAGVEKAGDLIDKQTGGKYAEKVDTVQQKVGNYVDSQSTKNSSSQQSAEPPTSSSEQSSGAGGTGSVAGASGAEAETGPDDGAPDAAGQAGSSSQAESDNAESIDAESDKALSNNAEGGVGGGAASETRGGVVGGEAPDPASEPNSSAGSRPEGIQTGGTVTGRSEPPLDSGSPRQ
jgi:hypothetical protein